MAAPTTDACLEILEQAGLRDAVTERILAAVGYHLERRAAGSLRVGAVIFSNEYGLLGRTETAARLMEEWK